MITEDELEVLRKKCKAVLLGRYDITIYQTLSGVIEVTFFFKEGACPSPNVKLNMTFQLVPLGQRIFADDALYSYCHVGQKQTTLAVATLNATFVATLMDQIT